MSSLNLMEVITKGRDVCDVLDPVTGPISCHSSTSHSTRIESQLSLEYLPPEAPYYGGAALRPQPLEDTMLPQDSPEEEIPPAETSTDQLYQRIQALSEQIHSEFDTLIDIESVSSSQPTPVPGGVVGHTTVLLQDQSRDSSDTPDPHSSELLSTGPNKCRDLVCVPDSEMDDDSTANTTPAPRASSNQSFVTSNPKLKKAFDKMKKLDEKLADLEKKEKEVKKQRKLLEQQMEIENSGNLSTTSPHSLDRELYSPVFTTQLNDNSSTAGDSSRPANKGKVRSSAKTVPRTNSESQESEEAKTKSKAQTEISGMNFIKRNIELASDAGALVAMTEAEKQRLVQLVGGDEEEEEDEADDNTLSVVAVRDPQEGFGLNQEDEDRMRTINSQLQAIPPPNGWEHISCPSRINSDRPDSEEDLPQITSAATDRSHTELGGISEDRHTALVAMPTSPGKGMFQPSENEQERLAVMLGAIREERQPVTPLSQSALQALLDQCDHPLFNSHSDSHRQLI